MSLLREPQHAEALCARHYKKPRTGEIAEFTGAPAPYEAPETPELVINTGQQRWMPVCRKCLVS